MKTWEFPGGGKEEIVYRGEMELGQTFPRRGCWGREGGTIGVGEGQKCRMAGKWEG